MRMSSMRMSSMCASMRIATKSAAALLAVTFSFFIGDASATPLSATMALRSAVTPAAQTVWWGGGPYYGYADSYDDYCPPAYGGYYSSGYGGYGGYYGSGSYGYAYSPYYRYSYAPRFYGGYDWRY
jgi:hypothetical protein